MALDALATIGTAQVSLHTTNISEDRDEPVEVEHRLQTRQHDGGSGAVTTFTRSFG